MSRLRVLPHLTVRDDRVHWGAWWRLSEDGGRASIGPHLDAWDYAQPIELVCDVGVDAAGALEDAGLATDAGMSLVAVWDCPASMDRGTAVERVLTHWTDGRWEGTLRLSVPAGSVAQELILERHLVLADPGPEPRRLAARALGARLGPASRDRLVLEGDGSRFPIEPLDFVAAGRENAVWSLEVDYDDPSDSFLGCVRLLVNTAHPAGRALLGASEQRPELLSMLHYDLTRKVLTRLAADRDAFSGISDHDDDSLGAVAEEICRTVLQMDLASTLRRLHTDPLGFDAILQARMGFLRVLGAER